MPTPETVAQVGAIKRGWPPGCYLHPRPSSDTILQCSPCARTVLLAAYGEAMEELLRLLTARPAQETT